jgi:hypothetical protein
MGIAYRYNCQWQQAIDAFRNAIYTAPNDSIKYELEITLAVTYIASGNYSAGEILLLKLGIFTDTPHIKEKASFLRGVACLYNHKWKSARDAFGEYFINNPEPALQLQIDTLLAQAEQFFYKSPDDARGLSTFIPGLGQIYAGDWRNGLNAFILSGGLEAAIIYKLWNGYIGDAYIIYTFLFRRYYTGNRYHAERIAGEYNANLNQHQVDTVMKVLLEK